MPTAVCGLPSRLIARHEPAHAELLGGHAELVVGQVRALREEQVARERVRLVEDAVGAPPERQLLGRLDHPHLLAVLRDRLELRVLQEDRRRLRELPRREVPVGRDPLAVVAALLQSLEDPLEEIDLRALLDLALVRERAVGVLEVEVVLRLRRPPALDEVAVEARVEPDRREPVRRQKHRERPLGRREEEAREVDDVHRVREPDPREPVLAEVRLERLRARLVPLEREPVERSPARGRRRPSGRARRSASRPRRATAGRGERRERAAAARRPRSRGPRDEE